MATLVIGKLVIDTEDLSESASTALLQFEDDGVMTDEVIAALSSWTKAHRVESGKDGEESKSSKMRRMSAAGMSTGAIAEALGVRFQFVYNILRKESQKAG